MLVRSWLLYPRWGSILVLVTGQRKNMDKSGPGLRFVLGGRPVGEVEHDARDQSDEQTYDKSYGEAQWCNIAVKQERQQNGRTHCQAKS